MTTKTIARNMAGFTLPLGAIAEGLAITRTHVPAAIAGLAVLIVGVAAIVTLVIDAAIRDTSEDRRNLHAAQARATDEYTRCIAMRAVLDAETDRVLRGAEQAEAARERSYQSRLEELVANVEDMRASIKREGYELALDHMERGILTLPAQQSSGSAQVIAMPQRPVGSTASGQEVNVPS
ncbi:hypothetical protein [Kitasatospora camelliae]|uniref:Uncharacterized protein n=1 Tax=Kitasatospora camelliae TaxID=3156397 RepID=A0AAU8K4K7_9ACTN